MKKISISTEAVTVFTFLLSENILRKLYFSSGNPIISYLFVSAFLLLFTCVSLRYFSKRKNMTESTAAKFFASAIALFAVISMAYSVAVYAVNLGTFADYYATLPVMLFAVPAVVISGICCARKGRVAVSGFSRMVILLMVVWLFAGFFGFFHTKNPVLPDSPIKRLAVTDFVQVAKDCAFVALDMVLISVILFDNRSVTEKIKLKKQFIYGVVLFIAISGINMLKNIFMFGEDFVMGVKNPDLAAIRLVPMFELPEISVLISTFAVAVRLAVYFCALLFMLKDSFGKCYSSAKSEFVLLAAVIVSSFAVLLAGGSMNTAEYISLISLAVMAVMCFAFYSKSEKR